MRIQKKQLTNLVGYFYNVNNFTIPSAGSGFTSAGLSTAINSVLSLIVDGLGADLSGTETGDDTTAGFACNLERLGQIRVTSTQDPIWDDINNYEVAALISKKSYSAGLTITGIVIDYVSELAAANGTSNKLRYTPAGTTLEFSSDGGSNYGTPVDISTLVTNDCVFVENNGSSVRLSVRRTAPALPGILTTDTLTVANTNYAFCFITRAAGAYAPYYNTNLVAIDFTIPVIASWEAVSATNLLDMTGAKFIDISGGSGSNKWIVESVSISAPNTISNLSFTPFLNTAVSLELNGIDLIYTTEFTLAGKVVTYIPVGAGYNIDTTDRCIAKYFKQ